MVQRSEQGTDVLPEAPVSKATTAATFANDVLTESGRQPVLVDFWAPWCQPCKQLTPVLEKAVKAAQGKVKLVTMNIDEHPQIAGQLGIRSIPAVIAFQRAPAGRRLYGRLAGKPGARLYRAPRRPAARAKKICAALPRRRWRPATRSPRSKSSAPSIPRTRTISAPAAA